MAGLAIPQPKVPRPAPPLWVPPRAPKTVDGTSLLIGGRETTDTDLRYGSLRCELLLDARGKLSCQLVQPPVAPAIDMDVLFTLAGVPLFGGIVVELTQTDVAAWSVVASDNRAILDGIQINNISPAGTLKSVLEWFVLIALGTFGFTVDPAQPAGPDLPALGWPFQSFAEALTQLGTISKWTAVISPTRVIRMYPGGTVPAPWTIDEDSIETISLRQSREGSATVVWVRFGSGAPSDVTFSTVGDGVAVSWAPPYNVATPPNVVLVNAVSLPVFPYPDPGWSWEATGGTGRLHAPAGDPPLTAADTIACTFTAAWPSVCSATTAGLQKEVVVDYPDVFDAATAQSLADGELARRAGTPRTFQLRTARVGLLPGQSAPIVVPAWPLATTALVTGVRLAHAATLQPNGAIWWTLAVDLIEANASRTNWLTYWTETKGGAGAGGGTGSSVTGTIPPGLPTGGTNVAGYATWPLGGDHDSGVISVAPAWKPITNAVLVTPPASFTGRVWTVHVSVKRLLGAGTFEVALGVSELVPPVGTSGPLGVSGPFDATTFTAAVVPGSTYVLLGRCSDAATLYGASGYLEAVLP